jgi:hypothetical protein
MRLDGETLDFKRELQGAKHIWIVIDDDDDRRGKGRCERHFRLRRELRNWSRLVERVTAALIDINRL